MLLLVLYALVAGAATAVSPCVLPVLPIALSGGATGGPRRPLGIVTGLALSFTFAVVALVYVISALGLPDDLLRDVAIVVLLLFGVALLVPPAATWLETAASRAVSRVLPGGVRAGEGEGFWSGVLLGTGLGIVYFPCAGPILAGVITTTASQPFGVDRLIVAFAYGLGSAFVLFWLMVGGRRLARPLARRSAAFQSAMGAVMVVVAIAMVANLDTRFTSYIARAWPDTLVNPTKSLESSGTIRADLRKVRDAPKGSGIGTRAAAEQARAPSQRASNASGLERLAPAPEIQGTQKWFNTPGGRPVSLAARRGKVTLIDFWTYTCINCIRTLPELERLQKRYGPDGFSVVGIHTPEFPFERSASNVQAAVKRFGITYPVGQDNDMATWNAYSNEYWPASYLVDATGEVRWVNFGEGRDAEKEAAIRALLRESGKTSLPPSGHSAAIEPSAGTTSPESYLGAARAQRIRGGSREDGSLRAGTRTFGPQPKRLALNAIALGGTWGIDAERATPVGRKGTLSMSFDARRVYLVLRDTRARPGGVTVRLDGRPIAASAAGDDVRGGRVSVRAQRLYDLVDLPRVARHRLDLTVDPGVEAYAFTFG